MIKNSIVALPILMMGATAAHCAERPNVILIMADDLGWGDVGFNGNTVVKTPYMDKLSQDGVVFDRFYSACAVSSPTRASVLTGRNPYRTGIFSANIGILRPEEVTIPELLKAEGYATGHFGKWHLGTLTDKEVDAKRGKPGATNVFNPPSEHGYDDAFVTEIAVPTCDPMVRPAGEKTRWWNAVKEGDETVEYGVGYWDIDGNRVTEGLDGDDSRIIMDRVLPFIDGAVESKKPFFSVVWFHAPHVPFIAPAEYAAQYDGLSDEKKNYYGCITALDAQVGRLIEHLKASGTYDNTIIMFCSDNGPERETPGVTGGLKGIKRFVNEGGIRVPAFALWGDKIQKGLRTEEPCFTSDYLPTIIEACGAKLPTDRVLDGESITPVLKDKKFDREKPMVFCFRKLGAVMHRSLKLYYGGGKYEMYNIEEDRSESKNIIDQYPEEAALMKKELEDAMADYKNTFDGGEYGTESVKRLPQRWATIFTN